MGVQYHAPRMGCGSALRAVQDGVQHTGETVAAVELLPHICLHGGWLHLALDLAPDRVLEYRSHYLDSSL